MSENYAGSEYKKYTTMLRDILKDLPPFCQEFFRGIQNDTMVRTRYAYAFDLRIFFRFLVMQPEFSNKTVTSLTFADLDRVTTSTIEDFLSYISYYTDEENKEYINGDRAKARKLSTLRAFYKYFCRRIDKCVERSGNFNGQMTGKLSICYSVNEIDRYF